MFFTLSKFRAASLKLLLEKHILLPIQQRNLYENRNILNLHKQGLFEDLFPENSSNEIKNILVSGEQTVYAGFDPTAASLHVGNLLIIKNLLHWQRSGHNVIVLIGNATAQIGDPSGRARDREPQARQVVRSQGIGIRKNIENVFKNHEKYFWSTVKDGDPLKPVRYVNNEDWYKNMNIIDFLNEIGRHFRMGTMLLKDSVKKRLDSNFGMCFTEFTYQIFQAYDWYNLFKNFDCKFQVGGKDQMGNIVAGHNFISRYVDQPVYGFTLPLIVNDAGDKIGKSIPNPLWLDSALTSPFDFYQFFIRIADKDVEKMLNLFTFLKSEEIRRIVDKHMCEPEKRYAQTVLANDVTLLVHGEEGLEEAKLVTKAIFSSDIQTWGKLGQDDLQRILKGATIVDHKFRPGLSLIELVMTAKCFPSKADARRIITAGGLYVNLQRATNFNEIISQSAHILPNKTTILRVGRKHYYIIRWMMESF